VSIGTNDLARAIGREWSRINSTTFGGALQAPPTIEVDPGITQVLGTWNATTRIIRLSEAFVTTRPWWVVVEVLKHEMAHQYVSDVLCIGTSETSHGPAFRMVCERYGIDGRAGRVATEEDLHVVNRIRNLLALSSNNDNAHEAQNALAAAQKLLGQHGLTEEAVQACAQEEIGVMSIGEIMPKHELVHNWVNVILCQFFNVRSIWIHRYDPRTATKPCVECGDWVQLEIMGKRGDLLMAEYVHGWLLATAERLTPTHLTKRKQRLDFQAGVVKGHYERLTADANAAKAIQAGRSTSMVRLEAEDLEDYFDRRYPSVRRSGSRRKVGEAFHAGVSTGRSLSMSRPMAGRGPKLLRGKGT
jgi:hypothetical protein